MQFVGVSMVKISTWSLHYTTDRTASLELGGMRRQIWGRSVVMRVCRIYNCRSSNRSDIGWNESDKGSRETLIGSGKWLKTQGMEHITKLEPLGFCVAFFAAVIECRRATDRQTNGRTQGHSIYRVSIASRGKRLSSQSRLHITFVLSLFRQISCTQKIRTKTVTGLVSTCTKHPQSWCHYT